MNRTTTLLILSLILAACSKQPSTQTPPGQISATSAEVAAGKVVAEQKCVTCHGLDGKGTGPDIPNLGAQKFAYLLDALNGYKTGSRPHAALQQLSSELSDADVHNIAAFYASLKPVAPTGSASGGNPALLGKTDAGICTTCHGVDGISRINGIPSLAGQHPGFLINAMTAYQTGARSSKVMALQVPKLDRQTMERVALFFASQMPAMSTKPMGGDARAGEPLSGKCGGCHGQMGHSADDKTPSLAGQDPAYLVLTMQDYRDGGRQHAEMKTMLAGVGNGDLEAIAAFYAKQKPQQARFKAPMSGKVWAERCDKCHGPEVNNPSLVAPRLEGQPPAYLVKALKDYREGKRLQSAMHAMGQPLTDLDIQTIADYYSSLAPR